MIDTFIAPVPPWMVGTPDISYHAAQQELTALEEAAGWPPLKYPRIPSCDAPAENGVGLLDELLAATPAEYGLPVIDQDIVFETDIPAESRW